MKKLFALLLAVSIIGTGCAQSEKSNFAISSTETAHEIESSPVEEDLLRGDEEDLENYSIAFPSLGDDNLLQYVRDNIYSELECSLASDDYRIENISTVYISREYLDEIAYNSKANIYFGYSIDDIAAQFDGEKYIFTCDDNGETIVTEYEYYDDTFDQIVQNVAIGSGIILVCVTVSVISGGAGAPVVSAVFAASAKTGAIFALSSGALSGTMAAAVTGYKTRDMKQSVEAASLAASEGFKWGAITGVVTGGFSKTLEISKAAKTIETIPCPKESEQYASAIYGGEDQVSYLAGKRVGTFTQSATRPDIVINKPNGAIEAIEVKNYDLVRNKTQLYKKLEEQITDRVANLPEGSSQRIVLDTRGRGYSKEIIKDVVDGIHSTLNNIYPNIPIDIL